MIKMEAIKDMETMDGKFVEGDKFIVNDERARVLERTGLAKRCVDLSDLATETLPEADAPDEQASVQTEERGLGVPKRPADE